MSVDPAMRGLSLDQAPPLSIPMAFFLTAPLALCAAGALVVSDAANVLASRFSPTTLGTVHAGTLGFFAMVMLGALYQMLPVVAVSRVPWVRLAHGVHALLVLGAATLAVAMVTSRAPLFHAAGGLLGLAFALFLAPVAVAVVRARGGGDTLWGMRLALASLMVAIGIGIELALGRAGEHFVSGWAARLLAHVGLGLTCWIGGLVVAVSWQVVPMFYLTDPFPRWARVSALGAVSLTLASVTVAVALGAEPVVVAACLVPAALSAWGVQPVVAYRLIARRRRRRVGESVKFWIFGLACGPTVLVAGALAWFFDAPRWTVLFGWLALAGWGGMIVHGMLTRIVPFLVWFHRYASQVGLADVPSMRDLLPDKRARAGLAAHGATVVVGALAIVLGWPPLVVATGAGLAVTGALLFVTLVRAVA